jgi:hypothetical protein
MSSGLCSNGAACESQLAVFRRKSMAGVGSNLDRAYMGGTSVLNLGSHLLESILSLIEQSKDRDACFRVCQAFRDAERQTRWRMRLRCTKSQIEQVPMSACFSAVRTLDISSVLPRQAHFSYSPSQLEHLRRCFPNVRELTIFCDGCHTWFSSGKVPFQAVWPKLEAVVVLEPTAEHEAYSGVDLGLAPLVSSIHLSTDEEYGIRGPLVSQT